MAIGAAAVLGGALAGFSGGLGYGTGLQYSYSRGFPAFQAGGMQQMYDTLRSDISPIYGILGSALGGSPATNKSGLTYEEWMAGAKPKGDLRQATITYQKPKKTSTMIATENRYKDIVKKQVTPQKSKAKVEAEMEIARLKKAIIKNKPFTRSRAHGGSYNSKVVANAKKFEKDAMARIAKLARVR